MIVKQTILVVFGLLLVIGTACAADLSNSTITNSNTGFIIANDGTGTSETTSSITVHVMEGLSLTDVTNAHVTFTLPDPTLGTLSPASADTGTDGLATTTFTVGSASGNATITAIITYDDGTVTTHTLSTFQNIDHEIARYPFYDYPAQVPAGSVTPVIITLTDRYGNRIDNKNTSESHLLHLSGLGSGGSGFWDGSGYVPELYNLPTDAEGNASVNIQVSTIAGYNIVGIASIGYIPDAWPITIEGVSHSDPVTITQLYPTPVSWPADGTHTFNLYYTVKDRYGNTLDGTPVWINSSTGESFLTNTSNGGLAYTSYGPKDVTGVYTITAAAVANASILCTDTGTTGYCSQSVEYYSQEPVDMILTASPQTLVSLDVDSLSQSIVQARVVDVAGNPVSNETVYFTNTTESYPGAPDGNYNITAESYITASSAVTDSNGFATATFIPGKFPGIGETGYNATSTGRKTVTATWTNKAGTITKTGTATFTWKNYPYLTVITQVDKTSAKIGDALRLTITVSGNGAALQPKPIDVVIDMDRSGSMLENGTALADNMVVAKSAASVFASCLSQSRDRIGIVSYGDNSATDGWVNLSPTEYRYNFWGTWYTGYDWSNVYGYWYWVARDSRYECGTNCDGYSSSYSPTAAHQVYLNKHYNNGQNKDYGTTETSSVDLTFGFNSLSDVNTALGGIVPGGGTPTRESIYTAVNQFPAYTPGRVRAIILQTDGVWNTGGNPEGGSGATSLGNGVGTGSVITYANSSKVALYVIGLGVSSDQETELRRYAANDAGQYYSASDASQLPEIYKQIAGDLNQQAGGSTALNLDMGSITVNGSVVSSFQYMNYTPIPVGGRGLGSGEPDDSTFVTMYHSNSDNSVTQYYNYTRDDSQNWTEASRAMSFNIGTMKLNDTWQTSMVFNLTKNGTLVLFGPDSGAQLSFTDSSTGITQTSSLDSKTVSVYQSSVNKAFGTYSLVVDQLQLVETPDPDITTMQWNTLYTGQSVAQVTVQYLSSEPGSQWVTLSQRPDKPPSMVPQADSLEIDTRLWTPGTLYYIMVTATAANDDASPSSAHTQITTKTTSQKTYIRLE